MDGWFYYFAICLIGVQILFNSVIIAVGIVELIRPVARHKYQGEVRMRALNQIAYSAVELGIGIILARLLYDGAISSFLAAGIATATGLMHSALKYLYSKRVPSPDSLETPNRYLPNTTAQAFLDEVHMRFEEKNQPESEAPPELRR